MDMNYKRKHIRIIRIFIFSFCFLSCKSQAISVEQNAMTLGVKLVAHTPEPSKYFDDLIHPCVRYISTGIAGHKWWMVGTPYRGGDTSIENPILYYGDSIVEVPQKWTATGIVEDTPKTGYNSDPCLYFDGSKLWIFWRENGTPDCAKNGYSRATFGKYTSDGVTYSPKKLFAGEKSGTVDSEMCPIVVNLGGHVRLFGCHHEFSPDRIPLGLSVWDLENNDLENKQFVKAIDVLPIYKVGFDFWHFDLFDYEGKHYCVVTPESANEILLGRSDDGINFKFWNTPLISTKVTGRSYLYKPTALVHNGVFYLWYPVAELGVSPRTSRIWMSKIKFSDLIRILETQDALIIAN